MARGRRRAPVTPMVVPPPEEEAGTGSAEEDVDDFVESRHKELAGEGIDSGGEEDNGSDLGVGVEAGVMDIAVSESSDEDDDGGDSESDDDGAGSEDEDVDTQWGGRRRSWYGGDTADYEIMDDDEQEAALQEEEDEARRLQTKALSKLTASDFVDSDDELGEEGGEADKTEADDGGENTAGQMSFARSEGRAKAAVEAAPELPALLLDLRECVRELAVLKERCEKGRGSRVAQRDAHVRYYTLSAYAVNIAFYLALRTDPEATGVDLRAHPVIAQIVRYRSLRRKLGSLGLFDGKEESVSEVGSEPDDQAKGVSTEQVTEMDATRDAEENIPAKEEGILKSHESAAGKSVTVGEKKKRKRGRRKPKTPEVTTSVGEGGLIENVDDDAFMESVVGSGKSKKESELEVEDTASKRIRLNKIVGSLERDRQSRDARRAISADMQSVRQDVGRPKHLRQQTAMEIAAERGPGGEEDIGSFGTVLDAPAGSEHEFEDGGDDKAFTDRMLAKKARKEAKLARKKAAEAPHVYSFDDSIKDKDLRRRASSQVVHNRGLTRYRPRDKKTPRAKNREAFQTAVKKRKSVVRDPVIAKPDSYGGEASGINMRARKGSRLANV